MDKTDKFNDLNGMKKDRAKVFVIMPFTDDFFESYEMLKSHFENDFEFSHAGEEANQQNILADIIPPIYSADIVLADLTGLNPNVMYELGIAHSFNKKTIVITRDELSKLPFDLKQYRAKDYSTHFKKFFELIDYLEINLKGAITGSVIYSNPVKDFLDKNKIKPETLFIDDRINIDIVDGEKGFLDFLADIEEDTEEMTKNLGDMGENMNTMSVGMNNCTQEIERVQKNGGSGTTAFVRKQAKKVADLIATFSKRLKEHNEKNTRLWTKIEKNLLGLLENNFAGRDENKLLLVGYLRALYGTQKEIRNSNESIESFRISSKNNLGLEKSMNQAIRFLDDDLAAYINLNGQMDASIDRVLEKSKFVVGVIDFTQEENKNNG